MRILVIDTATQALSVALLDDGRPVGHFHEIVGRGHAEALLPAIAALPDGGRADAIAVDVGPGSFTGVRIGIAAAKALALAWSIPVEGYTAPSLVAARAAKDHKDGAIAVTITGGHGELFWQMFDADGGALSSPASTPVAELARKLDQPVIYGTGAEALVTARGYGAAMTLYPDAVDYPLLANLPPLPPADLLPGCRCPPDGGADPVMTPRITLETYEQGERNALADAMDVMVRAFDPAFGEAWTLPQLAGVMVMPGTWLTIARLDAAPLGFALVRSVLDECELLLLAVDPLWRGKGIGKALLTDSLKTARRRGITSMNLEVRASNTAIQLYEKAGFEYVHRRPGYYRGNDGQLHDALSFRMDMLG